MSATITELKCPLCRCWYAVSGYRNMWPCAKDCDCHYEAGPASA